MKLATLILAWQNVNKVNEAESNSSSFAQRQVHTAAQSTNYLSAAILQRLYLRVLANTITWVPMFAQRSCSEASGNLTPLWLGKILVPHTAGQHFIVYLNRQMGSGDQPARAQRQAERSAASRQLLRQTLLPLETRQLTLTKLFL
ncbi:MAG: hypothetical protein NT154_42975 [Verrucomicrobia bacterium]|nr:hypothetical protein [Verrucomicrobiota bacterium]